MTRVLHTPMAYNCWYMPPDHFFALFGIVWLAGFPAIGGLYIAGLLYWFHEHKNTEESIHSGARHYAAYSGRAVN